MKNLVFYEEREYGCWLTRSFSANFDWPELGLTPRTLRNCWSVKFILVILAHLLCALRVTECADPEVLCFRWDDQADGAGRGHGEGADFLVQRLVRVAQLESTRDGAARGNGDGTDGRSDGGLLKCIGWCAYYGKKKIWKFFSWKASRGL